MDTNNHIQHQKNEQLKEQKQFVNEINIENTDPIGPIKEKTKNDKSNSKKFLDVHSLKGFDEEALRKLQDSPKDEFGITHINMMYNKEEDKFFCLLEAPNKGSC